VPYAGFLRSLRDRAFTVIRPVAILVAVTSTMFSTATGQAASTATVEEYLVRAATAWEAYTTPNGQIIDPLVPEVRQDNYGSIMLADTMLQLGARRGDATLEATGAAIVNRSLQLPETSGPFNLEAVAEFIHDGEAGRFPLGYWPEVAGAVRAFGAHIVGASRTGHCLPVPTCYNNWHLVWAAGILSLLQSGVPLENAATLQAEALEYLEEAGLWLSKPSKPTLVPGAAELSDPGAEPSAYAAFSDAQLEEIADAAPSYWNRKSQRLRTSADAWLLQEMAPDGQLVYAGRSLDQSWAQTAAAYVGARESALDPERASEWSEFTSRAFSYLESAYGPDGDGIIPVVPGLMVSPEPAIMDPYASENCYAGMTLWWLVEALDNWPADPPSTALPADAPDFVVGDLASSGLVWGRSGSVWWSVQGRRVCGGDPRCEQGLADVMLLSGGRWRALLALRPIQRGQSSQWELGFAHHFKAVPEFTRVSSSGSVATLHGFYYGPRRHRRKVTWRVLPTATGVVIAMRPTSRASVSAKIWLAPQATAEAINGETTVEPNVTTASGVATPELLRWAAGTPAILSLRGAGSLE